jgi:hypothetical protein
MDTLLFDLLFIALVFWAGYTWGKWTAVRRIIENIVNDPEHLGRALDDFRTIRNDVKDSEKDTLDVRVERHGDQLYLYDAKDNEFLAQGSTLDSALAAVNLRYPDRKYTGKLTREQAEELGIKP